MISVSIVIPIYNVEPYIEECLQSVMAQTYTGPMECILVDDCGTDRSIEIARRMIGDYTGQIRFEILHHDHNRGLSASRNTGIKAATGDYFCFVDSDDSLFPDAVEKLADVAAKYPGVELVQGDTAVDFDVLPSPRMAVSRALYPEFSNDRQWCAKTMMGEFPRTAWSKLIKRSFILDNDLYYVEGLLHEDDMWRIQASRKITSIGFCFNGIIRYRTSNPSSITNWPDTTNRVMSDFEILRELIEGLGQSDYINEIRHINYITSGWRKKTLIGLAKDKPKVAEGFKRIKKVCKEQNAPWIIRYMIDYYSRPFWLTDSWLYRRLDARIRGRHIK